MYDKLVFYLAYGAGDIFESREFTKEYMSKIPAKEYYYAHGKPNYILGDIENLQQTEILDFMDMRKAWFIKDNCLYINMWIGRDGKYVLPGIGCVVEELYRMHNDILESLNLPMLSKDIYDYIPKLDFSKITIESNRFFSYDRRVLICNGNVQSNQAENFDFSSALEMLCDQYQDILFVITAPIPFERSNLSDMSHMRLDYLAYLSTECDTIIGRNSGPHVFAQNLDNWDDPNKACLSFTYKEVASHFVLSNHLPMKKYWSPATDVEGVYNKIVEVINR